MMRSFLMCALFFVCLITAQNAVAQFRTVDPPSCIVTTRATEPVSLIMCPDADGTRLDRAQVFGGGTVDAMIVIQLLDEEGIATPYIPRLDLWLGGPGLDLCDATNLPDYEPGVSGITAFYWPLRGGGCMPEPGLRVYYNGDPLGDGVVPHIRVNSPDMNADGIVNLADVWRFAAAFAGYDYAADFVWDGVLNLADVGEFAKHLGHSCP